jgi:hypothetical protein
VADAYTRKPEAVLAVQWDGTEPGKLVLESLMRPVVARYQPDGNLIVSTQETTLLLAPTDWVVEHADASHSALSNEAFQAAYSPA